MTDRDLDAAPRMRRVLLSGGPMDRQYVQTSGPLRMDLYVDGLKYIFWKSATYATDGKVSEHTVYAFSGSATRSAAESEASSQDER